MDCSIPGFPVYHQLPELAQTHVHWVSDAIQPSHPLSSPSPAFSLSQHQGLFQWSVLHIKWPKYWSCSFSISPSSEYSGLISFRIDCVLVDQLCLTLCDPMDCNPPGSSVHGILQARILKWVAIPFSRGSFQSRDQTQVSCLAGRFFTTWPPEKPIGLINALLEDCRELPYLFHHVRTWQSMN